MSKKTTVKATALAYRNVGSTGAYTPFMGVLKGLTLNQDAPDSTEIEAEFYDAPIDPSPTFGWYVSLYVTPCPTVCTIRELAFIVDVTD